MPLVIFQSLHFIIRTTEINIANNQIGLNGTDAVVKMLEINTVLTKITFSGDESFSKPATLSLDMKEVMLY